MAELDDPAAVGVEEARAPGAVDLAERGGFQRGVLAGDDAAWASDWTMPATSSAAGIGSIRCAAGSTGLPSKSVTTKRVPLRST